MPLLYQFKITLKDTKPPIWRRIMVNENSTFYDLSLACISAAGWSGLHYFTWIFRNKKVIGPQAEKMLKANLRKKYGAKMAKNLYSGRLNCLIISGDGDGNEELNESLPINQLFLKQGQHATFDYNSSTAMEFDVTLEKIVESSEKLKHPICVKASKAMPFEELNGVWEYYESLELANKPKSKIPEEYQELVELVKDTDPEFVDLNDINEAMMELSEIDKNIKMYREEGKEHLKFEDPAEDLVVVSAIMASATMKDGKFFLDRGKLDEFLKNSAEISDKSAD